jgi:diguanylate cyclase (GGDEF)-like protein/PAS domain S-box-containing protein
VYYAVWLMVSGGVALWVGWLAWRRRPASGARELTILMLGLAIWAFSYAFYWLAPDMNSVVFWTNIMFVGVIITPVAFFLLVQYYIGNTLWLSRRSYAALLVIPIISIILVWTDSRHGLFFGYAHINSPVMLTHGGPWFYVFAIYSHALMAVSVFLLIRFYQRASNFYRRQVRMILFGILMPWFVNGFVVLGWEPAQGLDLTPILFSGTGLLLAYGLFGYRMMDIVPVGRDVLVEHLDDAIVLMDTRDRIVDVNPKALEFADPSVSQPVGRHIEEVFPGWAKFLTNGSTLKKRSEIRLEDSAITFLDMMAVPVRDRHGILLGKLASWHDISERKKAEEQLRIFEAALEQNPTAIVITDPDGLIKYVNPSLVKLTGYTLEDLEGRTPDMFQSGETEKEKYAGMWETIQTGAVWKGELLNRNKSGQIYWVSELIAPVLNESGEVTHFVAMQEDITDRKHAESELRKANACLQVQLEENENLQRQLREEAIHDGLTRLFNRRYMEESLAREISLAQREPRIISVVMMDVDRFKSINDKYGHQAGDFVLQTLANMLMEHTRKSDIACRYGGDEMLVVMPGATGEAAMARAEEWRAKFSTMEFALGDGTIRTSLSLGIACFPEHAQNPSDLLNASDKALYWSKVSRNQVQMYTPETMGRYQYRAGDFA